MQSIQELLRSLPEEDRNRILFSNPSYVFFQVGDRRAVTALGVPASAGRTIAVDPAIVPLGALALVTERENSSGIGAPGSNDVWRNRLVLSQDTGSAIKGASRIDLFCGRVADAGSIAGSMQSKARVLYLVPR
jgi:membrane-bound lytic murein transglycosylase A